MQFFVKKNKKNSIAQGLRAMPPDPRLWYVLELHHFAQLTTQLRHFSSEKILTFGPSSPLLAKSWLHACLRMCRGVEILDLQNR